MGKAASGTFHIEDSPSPWRGLKTTMMVPGEGGLNSPHTLAPNILPGEAWSLLKGA